MTIVIETNTPHWSAMVVKLRYLFELVLDLAWLTRPLSIIM
jgi:hypothetical protein